PLAGARAPGAEMHDRPAVRERLMHREVGGVVALLELRPVERAAPAVCGAAPALRALPRACRRTLLDEQRLDAGVGRCIQHLLPAGGRALAAPVRLLEPLE